MRILADENVPRALVEALRARGHDVQPVPAGADDTAVLRRAVAQRRVLLTRDRDFGELQFARGRGPRAGVVLVRARGATAAALTRLVLRALDRAGNLAGAITVITPNTIRRRAFPRKRRRDRPPAR